MPEPSRLELDRLDAALAAFQKEIAALPKPQMVYAAANVFPLMGTFRWPIEPRPVYLLGRGSVESPGELMKPGALSAVAALPARFEVDPADGEGARRAALAKWLSDPRNPLTWRSIVNRIWQHHFGTGIVDTPNDFGRMGSKPTHPELLDWLASELQIQGGSLKKLHREIVLSATYRQSSDADSAKQKIDSNNRFLWRMNRRRLDAEAVRDATLAVSGKLDLTMGGPSAEQFWFKDDHSPVYDYSQFNPDSPGSYRRSVYRFLVRSVPDPFMERLDCPDASLVVARRNETITAIQALALLNNRFMVRQAEHLAARLRAAKPGLDEQIRLAWQLTASREPDPGERQVLVDYAARHGLENACRLLLNSNEFLFVD